MPVDHITPSPLHEPWPRPSADAPALADRLLVDGFNLAGAQGTGIATYGRCLVSAARPLFRATGLLLGQRARKFLAPAPYDLQVMSPPVVLRTNARDRLQLAVRLVTALGGVTAHRVPMGSSTKIDMAPLADRLPGVDEIHNAWCLFRVADAFFRLTGRLLPVRLADGAPDVMHWTAPIPARLVGARNVYTIHDLVPLRQPYTTLDHKGFMSRLLASIAASADHIATVSEASRADIVSMLGVAPEKVTSTHQSVDPELFTPSAPEAVIRAFLENRLQLGWKRYFLFLGAIEPKKNLRRLIQAYIAADVDIPLVVVGRRAWLWEDEVAPIRGADKELAPTYHLGRGKEIRFLDYVPAQQREFLLRGARALTFPSIAEGFGLPILEAMATGTAVLTADRSAMKEVAGDAALLVDALDVAAVRAGIERLAHDDSLAASLVAPGIARARQFDEASYRAKLVDLYRRTTRGG